MTVRAVDVADDPRASPSRRVTVLGAPRRASNVDPGQRPGSRSARGAVLAACGFDDIEVPPCTAPSSPGEGRAAGAFEDRVIDRLFALNEARAAEEARERGGG
ncbi:hypothetical protein WME91_46570 [Sorangium sp. So ce269]